MRRAGELLKEDGPDANVLVVEGEDDFFAMKKFFERTKLLGRFQIHEGGGYERLRESIDTRLDASGLERLGVVIDADEDLQARWNSIRGTFVRAGYKRIPTAPEPEGTIVQSTERPVIGIWVMPNNQVPGELEDFVRLLIPAEDNLWPRAIAAVDGIPVAERLFDSLTKAQLHTWLAWQAEPGKPIGTAIVKRYFSIETSAAESFRSWLQRLFAIDAS